MSTNCDAFVVFPIEGQFHAHRNLDSGRMAFKTYIFIKGAYPGRLGGSFTGLGAQTLAPKKTLFKFCFFSYISTKNVEITSNDFRMPRII